MKLFQIYEDDLAELERTIPQIAESTMLTSLDNRLRVKFRLVQAILSRVRWNYGPPTDIEVIPADE